MSILKQIQTMIHTFLPIPNSIRIVIVYRLVHQWSINGKCQVAIGNGKNNEKASGLRKSSRKATMRQKSNTINLQINIDKYWFARYGLAKLSFSLKEDQIMGLERRELYGTIDLVANFGGLLGLFTGFSLLSLVEIAYFCSLRLFCNFRMFGLSDWYDR